MKDHKFSFKNLWLAGLAIIALVAFVIVKKCCPKDSKPPVSPLVVIRESIKAPTSIAFFELGSQPAANVPEVHVTLIDPAGQVLSPNGDQFASIDLHGGVMSVGLSPQAQFSVDTPYRFFIRAEAAGYMTNLKPIVITADAVTYVPMYLAKLDPNASIEGVATSVKTITDVNNGLINTEQLLSARSTDSDHDRVKIKIPSGTQLLYNGKPVENPGSLSSRLLTGNPLDSTANLVFPGGFEVTDAMDASGKPIDSISPRTPAYFRSAGWFSMEMNIGNQVVNGFSQPVEVELAIPQGVVNSDGTPLLPGQKVPLWSLNNETGVWTREGETQVEKDDNGEMSATFQVSHLSSWNMDFFGPSCPGTLEVTYVGADFPGTYYVQYIRSLDNAVLPTHHNLVDFSTDGNAGLADFQLELQRVPSDPARIFVYDGADATFLVRGRSSAMSCSSSPNTLGRLGSASFPCVSVQFTRIVNIGGVDQQVPMACTNTVWHKTSLAAAAIHAGVLTLANSGKVRVQTTASGQQYLQLWYTDNSTPPAVEVLLTFRLDFGDSSLGGDVWRNADEPGAVHFNYTIGPAADGCGNSITIEIPSSVLGGLVCP